MGKVDVISAVFESFELIKEHYQEVAVPLLVLILISAAGHVGGSGFSKGWTPSSSGALAGSSLVSNSMLDGGILALGGFLLAIVVLLVLAVIALCIVSEATQLYVYEHFYALLTKRKIKEAWTARFGRLAIKAAVIQALWLVIMVAAFIMPALQLWNAIAAIQSLSVAGILGAIMSVAFLLVAGIILLLIMGFVLTPLWIYYAMDNCGIIDSVGKSITLVVGNFWTFLLLGFIFALLGLGSAGVAMASACCCLSWLVSPIISVFLSLLWGVTLMKVKLAIEK